MAKKVYVGAGNFDKRELPSGYTQFEYLQANGAQYLLTDIPYSTSNKYVIEAECCWIGSTEGYSGWNAGGIFGNSGGVWHNGSTASTVSATKNTKIRLTIEAGASGNSILELTQDGKTTTITRAHASLATYAKINLPIFAYTSSSGGIEGYAYMQCKYFKVYVNGTLTADMVPCKNASGILGMYNMVTAKFHTNSGSGTFTAGTAYTEGVARKAKSIFLGVSAVARNIKSGYIGVNRVARQFWASLPAKKSLEASTWAEISEISKMGLASQYWSIGDTKSISFNGVTYLVQIIGFDHDTPTNTSAYGRSKAGITFQFGIGGTINNNGGVYNAAEYPMNNTATNVGGWNSSVMRTETMNTMRNYLPSALRSVLVAVNKKTSAGNKSTTINTTSDELFLLSAIEVFGTSSRAASGEGTQYSYYSTGNSKLRWKASQTSYAYPWQLRSPWVSYTEYFLIVGNNGAETFLKANESRGLTFAFCV